MLPTAKRQRRHASRKRQSASSPVCEPAALASALSREEVISAYHQKQKQLSAALVDRSFPNEATRAARVQLLRAQLAVIGLEKYQHASLQGEGKGAGFDSSVWVLEELQRRAADAFPARSNLRLLDVGAIVHRFPNTFKASDALVALDATAIDLNPQDPSGRVLKADFFEFAGAHIRERSPGYDVVCLCLCVNFVGCPRQRGEMLRLAAKIGANGAMLFLTLPRACVDNSRFLDMNGLGNILKEAGWVVVSQRYSAKLVLVICTLRDTESKDSGVKMPLVRKQVIRKGDGYNNFAIELGSNAQDVNKIPKETIRRTSKSTKRLRKSGVQGAGVGKKPTSSNQRKRARKKARQKKSVP